MDLGKTKPLGSILILNPILLVFCYHQFTLSRPARRVHRLRAFFLSGYFFSYVVFEVCPSKTT